MEHTGLLTVSTGIALLFVPFVTLAGSLDNSASPSSSSWMPTTTQIYNSLDTGAGITLNGIFRDPVDGPIAGTGRSLAEVKSKLPVVDITMGATVRDVLSGKTFWGLRSDTTWGLNTGILNPTVGGNLVSVNGTPAMTIPDGMYTGGKTATFSDTNITAGNIRKGVSLFGTVGTVVPGAIAKRVNKTGQTGCWNAAGGSIGCAGTGMDGQYLAGVDPAVAPFTGATGGFNMPTYSGVRFNDNGDGTVTDGLTALVWLKKVDCYNGITWSTALSNANNLKDGNCSLSDGSVAGQWRLPNINELHSLGSVWPLSGSPFTGLAASLIFWSSSTHTLTYTDAWVVWFNNNYGFMTNGAKSTTGTINFWPVRGGL